MPPKCKPDLGQTKPRRQRTSTTKQGIRYGGTHTIILLRRLRQKDKKFKAILGYVPRQKKKKKTSKTIHLQVAVPITRQEGSHRHPEPRYATPACRAQQRRPHIGLVNGTELFCAIPKPVL